MRALDPETSLVHFLLHLTKDRFRFLLGFVDIARILERETLDHAFIDGFVRAEGLEVHYQLALEVVAHTLGSDVGDGRGAGGRVNRSPHNARAVLWRIVWRPAIRLQGELGAVRFRSRQLWIPLTARGRWGPALRHLARRLFPTPVLVDYRRPGGAITSGDSIGGAGKIRSDDVERPRGSGSTLGRFGPVAKLPAGKAAESGHLSVKRRPAAK